MDNHELLQTLADQGRELRDLIPEVYAGHLRTSSAATADGALSKKHKELIALAISATRECDGCIAAHGRNLARIGATRQEVAEALGVVISMNGGPGTVWGPRALAAFDEYSGTEHYVAVPSEV